MLAAEVFPNLSRLITTRSSRYLHLPGGGSYYACICLMGYQVLDLIRRECVAGRGLLDHVGQYRRRTDLRPFWKSFSSSPGWPARPAWPLPSAPRMWSTGIPFAAVEYDRASAVSEDGRRAVSLVDDGAHGVRPDEQDPACRARAEHG